MLIKGVKLPSNFFYILFFANFALLAGFIWYRCYYLHQLRDALSPLCGIFCHKIHYVKNVQEVLNVEGHQNWMVCSKVTALFLKQQIFSTINYQKQTYYAQIVKVPFLFCLNIYQLKNIQKVMNLKGNQNRMIGLKVTLIQLKKWIFLL